MKFISATTAVVIALAYGACVRGEGYALVVGVNDCPEFVLPDGSRARPLRGAETDADTVASLMVEHFGFKKQNVWLYKGSKATHAAIKTAFEKLIRQVKPDDVFVFHFSGHGTQIRELKPPLDEPDKLDEALSVFDSTSDGANLLLDDQLGLWLEEIPARDVTVLLDCCHAGTGVKDADDDIVSRFLPTSVTLARLAKPEEPWCDLQGTSKSLDRRLCAFFACHADQQAYERRFWRSGSPARAGQFSFFFLEGIKDSKADADHDGVVTQREVLEYIQGRLDRTFNRHRKDSGEKQQPVLQSDAADNPLFWLSQMGP